VTRILVVTNMYPPHHLGGYELACRDVVDRLRARGHEVQVLTSDVRMRGVAETRDGVARDLSIYWDDHVLLSPPPPRRLALERRNRRALRRVLDDFRPDVVSAWNMGAVSLGLLEMVVRRDIPLVLAVFDDWLVDGPKLDAWMRMFSARPLLGRITAAVTGLPTTLPDLSAAPACFISDFIRQRARAHSPIPIGHATVVYCGIDTRAFPIVDEVRMGAGDRLLYVGRLDRRKGIDTAIRALAHLPATASLDVDGPGDDVERRRLDALVAELGLAGRVRFATSARSELAARYRNADIFVFPSTWEEPFGLVPVEAMACGTPVIATRRGGSAEFLRDGENCLEFPAGDDAALARAVLRLAGDADLRRRLVAAGTNTARELTADRLTDVMEEWHLAAATGFAAGRPADRPVPGMSA
jgi:glycosyltransferase involved in cell wall biosynthesis